MAHTRRASPQLPRAAPAGHGARGGELRTSARRRLGPWRGAVGWIWEAGGAGPGPGARDSGPAVGSLEARRGDQEEMPARARRPRPGTGPSTPHTWQEGRGEWRSRLSVWAVPRAAAGALPPARAAPGVLPAAQ